MHRALLRYDWTTEAEELRRRTLWTLVGSLESVGSFAENFCAEIGLPLYARNFAAWNLLADVMEQELPGEFA